MHAETGHPNPIRIGFFGGTFDPPHIGHLAVALAAADRFHLDRVLLAPVGAQPLKPEGSSASFQDRLAMVRILCEADPRLQASEADAPRPDGQPNFTIDTLTHLRADQAITSHPDTPHSIVSVSVEPEPRRSQLLASQSPSSPPSASQSNGELSQVPEELFVIVGIDAFADLPRWRSPDALLQIAQWIVVSRPGIDPEPILTRVTTPAQRRHVHLLESVEVPISSTLLRARLKAHEPCKTMMVPGVLNYVSKHALYGSAAAPERSI